MAVTIQIGGASYDVPPFMLAELELAAPHVDRMNELYPEFQAAIAEGRTLPMAKQFALLRAQVEIIAIGLANVDVSVTPDSIMKSVNFGAIPSLGKAVNLLLASSGMSAAGEAKAPKAPAKGARASKAK